MRLRHLSEVSASRGCCALAREAPAKHQRTSSTATRRAASLSKGDADLRRRTVQVMWMDGAKLREIADTLGITVNTVGVTMARMRADGWDLPLRHAMWNGRRVAA